MLITELTKLEKFRVLESTTLDSIKDEIKMGDDGWIAPGEKVEKGNWKGADYMFVGKITRFANKSKSFGGGSGWGPFRAPIPVPVHGFDVTTTEAEVDIDWRVVDAASRDIIKSGRGQGRESGTSWGFRGGLGSGFVRQHEFLDSALGKATVKAIDQIVAQVSQTSIGPGTRARLQQAKADAEAANQQAVQDALRATPGEVRAVTPQFVIVSLGANHGLNPGDKLDLYEVNEVHNKKGEVVMRDEKRVGEVVVESVQAETSKARYDGAMKPEEGWVVRVAGAITAAAAKR
jgi:curli biogenesis system outer membrane secretion channel CsgG